MDVPPSRSSRQSCLSTLSSALPASHSSCTASSPSSPRPLSSGLSMHSENYLESEPGTHVHAAHLDRLLPSFNAMLSGLDQVNKVTEDVHILEMKLEEVLARRRKWRTRWVHNEDEGAKHAIEMGNPKGIESNGKEVQSAGYKVDDQVHSQSRISVLSSYSFTPSTFRQSAALRNIHPRTRCSFSESELEPFKPVVSCTHWASEVVKPTSRICGLDPSDCSGFGGFPRRRAWHSGSSHSADVAQRVSLALGNESFHMIRPRSEAGIRRLVSDGAPVKRTAWISEGSEAEQDKAFDSTKRELNYWSHSQWTCFRDLELNWTDLVNVYTSFAQFPKTTKLIVHNLEKKKEITHYLE